MRQKCLSASDQPVPPRIRIGPAGWAHLDCKGQMYPTPKPRGFDPLRYLAQYDDPIEINRTFYRTPPTTTARSWATGVADHLTFRLTAKRCQSFTHEAQMRAEGRRVCA